MWAKISEEMGVPWRSAEAMHWQIGQHEMAERAGAKPFTLGDSSESSDPQYLQIESATNESG
ncbi:predicted protein [Histoplasma mississippiense (nom. inval.)]|nr:predicted protein [Histoplasma mississippiense (nom. inval.)]EDN08182.1 predicted protein [Histoplasma mississippiense (nom. inval.)]